MRDQVNDSEEVDTPLMLDGTYLSRNFATLGPISWPTVSIFNGKGKNARTVETLSYAYNPIIRKEIWESWEMS